MNIRRLGWRYLYAAPELLALAVTGFSVAPMILLLLGHFTPALVLPLGVLGAVAAVTVYQVPALEPPRRELLLTAAAVAIVLVWIAANVAFTAENVYAIRDPATYNLAARWLMDHHSLVIDTRPGIFGSSRGTDATSAGFGATTKPGVLYAQGNHLLPALLAVAGWVFGLDGMLRANVVIGAAALFVFFGLARRVVGSSFALVAMTALAVSMPMIFVSRDTYTEPLALLFLMGGLSLLHRALLTGRVREFAGAGLVAGMSAAVRIDSYAALLALIGTAIVLVALSRPANRTRTTRQILAFLGAGALTMYLGWLDVTQLSSGYYHDQRSHIVLLAYAALALLLVAPVVVGLAWMASTRPVGRILTSTRLRPRLAAACSVLLILVAALLWSRPYWMTTSGTLNLAVAQLQRQQGVTVDGTRLYNERTLNWLALYVGWSTLALGLGGYLTLIHRLLRRGELVVLAPLATGLTMSALYLWTSQITPDQPWASRRYVPVVLPLLIIAACALLRVVRWRWQRWGVLTGGAGVLALLVVPLVASLPVATVREEVPQLRQVRAICAAVGPNAAVLMIDSSAQASYAQSVRSYCGVPASSSLQPSLETLRDIDAAVTASGRTLYVLAESATAFPGSDGSSLAPISSIEMSRWPSLINKVPRSAQFTTVSVYLATVDGEGNPVPITRR